MPWIARDREGTGAINLLAEAEPINNSGYFFAQCHKKVWRLTDEEFLLIFGELLPHGEKRWIDPPGLPK